jgi:hypothetical protein
MYSLTCASSVVSLSLLLQRTNRMAYTHCEIHPAMILGVCASIIPFPDHNQVGTSSALPDCTIASGPLFFWYRLPQPASVHQLHVIAFVASALIAAAEVHLLG